MRWPWFTALVSGESMAPGLRHGDRVVVRRDVAPRTGDVVVARHPQRPDVLIVKRLSAGPGETAYGAPLASGEYWLASDNPLVSPDDSRSFGPVRAGSLAGRVVWRYWPPSRLRRKGAASANESNR